jgi:hypothetical protein
MLDEVETVGDGRGRARWLLLGLLLAGLFAAGWWLRGRRVAPAVVKAPAVTVDAKPGLVPAVFPGDRCEKALTTYGKPTETDDKEGEFDWNFGGYSITVEFDPAAEKKGRCVVQGVVVLVIPGEAQRATADGIVLGKNTLADVENGLAARLPKEARCVWTSQGSWFGDLSVAASKSFPYETTYTAMLPPDAVDDDPDGETPKGANNPRFEDFELLPVNQYRLDPAGSRPDTECVAPGKGALPPVTGARA